MLAMSGHECGSQPRVAGCSPSDEEVSGKPTRNSSCPSYLLAHGSSRHKHATDLWVSFSQSKVTPLSCLLAKA